MSVFRLRSCVASACRVLGVTLCLAGIAHAQSTPTVPPATSPAAAAAAEFDAALAAVAAGNWTAARTHFSAAYALEPHPRTLFNLAGAQTKTGAFAEALQSYKTYLERSAQTAENVESRNLAGKMIEQLQAKVAHLRLEVTGHAPGDVVELNGERVLRPTDSLVRNPGQYTVEVRRGPRLLGSETVNATPGHDALLRLHLAAPTQAPSSAPSASASEDDSVLSSWWFWTAVGAVVVAGAVTTVVVVTGEDTTAKADRGNLPGWPVATVR